MRILHVGSGFRPLRRGGLVAYVEDLMAAQVTSGDEVSYLFAGRHYAVPRGPRLRRWERDGVAMLEIVDSPLYDHGRQPELELSEPRVERLFDRAVREAAPDVIHLQELAGLPSSVIDVALATGTPTILTLQDYWLLCPVFKLLDEHCLRGDVGAGCVATVAAGTWPAGAFHDVTIQHDLLHRKGFRRLGEALGQDGRAAVGRLLGGLYGRRHKGVDDAGRAAAYQRRRDVDVERLNRLDRVIAMSHRVAEVHALLGVEEKRLQTMHLTLAHIDALRPKVRRPAPGEPVVFATLASLESEAKGARVLLDAARTVSEALGSSRFRVLVFGHVDPAFAAEAAALDAIDVRRPYLAAEQDAILDEPHVGLVTSVWEEAYGYAGLELLAKGIPLVANPIGGIVDYAREGETAWLNDGCDAAGLAKIMASLVEHPERIGDLSERVVAGRDALITPMERHADEVGALYAELVGARPRTAGYDRAP